MVRFRLHRSRVFWFGLPGLLFILWAWADSMRYHSSVVLHRGMNGGTDTIRQFLGTIDFRWWLRTPEPSLALKHWRYPFLREPHEHRKVLPQPITFKQQDFSYGKVVKTRAIIIIPHWLILLTYLLVWGGLLLWRWKAHADHRKLVEGLAGTGTGMP